MGLTNRFGTALLVFLVFAGTFWAADASARSLVFVNSYNFEDIISGSVWAAQSGSDFLFVLTPEQGGYAVSFLSTYRSPIYYFESNKPIAPNLDTAIMSASNSSANLTVQRESGLSDWFADNAPGSKAIIVGRGDGAESISAAPYAVLTRSGLYFADSATLGGVVSKLKASGRSILVYGSIASSLTSDAKSGVEVLNSGSRYADNLELLKRFEAISPPKQVVFASGQTFEKSMVLGGAPVALVGLTEVSPDLIAWLKASNITTGKIISGDGDIEGAQVMLRQNAGIALFPAIGEGYPGDSQTRPLLVLPLPGPRPILVVDPPSSPVRYDTSASVFMIGVENSDHYPAYVRAVIQLPDGRSSASSLVRLAPGETRAIPVRLDAGAYANAGNIEKAVMFIYYGSSSLQTEYIRQLNYSKIPLAGARPMFSLSSPSTTSAVVLLVLAVVLLLAVFMFRSPKPAAKAPGAKSGAAKKSRKKKSRRK